MSESSGSETDQDDGSRCEHCGEEEGLAWAQTEWGEYLLYDFKIYRWHECKKQEAK